MKMLSQAAVVAALALLLSGVGYAAGQYPPTSTPYRFPPMVLPVAGPAVPASVTPGAGPETMATPAPRSASEARSDRVTERLGAIFTKARDAFARNDLKTASAEIRRGAVLIRKEEPRATAEGKKELAATAMELDRLARRIELQRVNSGSELEAVFARADRAIAQPQLAKSATPGKADTSTLRPTTYQSTAPRPDIPATATRQGMPQSSKEPVSAAYVEPKKPSTGPTYEELKTRVDALSREVASLKTELKKLKARESATKY